MKRARPKALEWNRLKDHHSSVNTELLLQRIFESHARKSLAGSSGHGGFNVVRLSLMNLIGKSWFCNLWNTFGTEIKHWTERWNLARKSGTRSWSWRVFPERLGAGSINLGSRVSIVLWCTLGFKGSRAGGQLPADGFQQGKWRGRSGQPDAVARELP